MIPYKIVASHFTGCREREFDVASAGSLLSARLHPGLLP